MASPLGSAPADFSDSPYMHPFRPAAVMNANRFDEGYSEDTRSQNETDMVMGAGDSGMDPAAQQFSLPDYILGLDEQQRSGMSTSCASLGTTADMISRNRFLHPALVTNLIHRQDRRETESSSAPGPCSVPSSRDHIPDLVVSRAGNITASFDAVKSMEDTSHGQSAVEATVPSRGLELQLPPSARVRGSRKAATCRF